MIFHTILSSVNPVTHLNCTDWVPKEREGREGPYLANIPGFDVLQFNQELLITACLELLYKYPAVGRLLVQKKHKMVSQT